MRSLCRFLLATLVSSAVVLGHASSASATEVITWADLGEETGVVVLVRHAIAPGGGDPAGFTLADCRTQRNLSAAGRNQAARIGERVRRSGIDIAAVVTSPWCRTSDTARLLDVASVDTRRFLGSTFTAPRSVADRRERQTVRFLESLREEQGVVVAVTHYANIFDLTGIATQSGEAVAVRIDESGTVDVIGRIPPP